MLGSRGLVAALALASAAGSSAFTPFLAPVAGCAARCTPTCAASGAFAGRKLGNSLFCQQVAPLRRARAGGLRGLEAMFTGIVEEMGTVTALKEEEMAAVCV